MLEECAGVVVSYGWFSGVRMGGAEGKLIMQPLAGVYRFRASPRHGVMDQRGFM